MADEIDSRMEQIRLKNEELEKKHKEILEDELEAKKQNATIVSMKEKGENYKHPYDDIELDYDVKDEEREEYSKNSNAKVKNTRKPILNKKSLDEIPPDPINFLREDQGTEATKSDQRPPQQEQQQNRNRKPQQRPRGGPYNNNKSTHHSSDNSNENPSFRSREHYQQQNNNYNSNNSRPREQQNMRKHNAHDNKMETQSSPTMSQPPRRPHPQALRNERRTVSSSAVSSNPEALNENEMFKNDVSPSHRQKRPTQKPPRSNNKEPGDRNNLTVQVGSDEVRSVKIKSVERVGSGRLGHAIANNNLSSEGNDNPEENAQTSTERYKNRNPKNKRNFKPKAPQTSEFKHPILDKIVIPKTSVQERLLRSRMSEDATPIESKAESDLSSTATPEIIENN